MVMGYTKNPMKFRPLFQRILSKEFLLKVVLVLGIIWLIQHIKFSDSFINFGISYLLILLLFTILSILIIPGLFLLFHKLKPELTFKKIAKLYFYAVPILAIILQIVLNNIPSNNKSHIPKGFIEESNYQ
jgi:hypothetical protein